MKKFFQLTARGRKKLNKLILYLFIGLIFGIVYAFIEVGLLESLHSYPSTGNPFDPLENSISTVVQSVLMAMILGFLEVFLLEEIFSKKSFAVKFFLKSVIYVTTILFCVAVLSIVSSSIVLHVPIYHPVVYKHLLLFFSNTIFWSIMVYVATIFSFSIFFSEISDHLGQNGLCNFLLGKYHKPREEERIFMFLDIKSSTALAEKLGHVNYFRLLNEYYADLTVAILETRGQIYQYVGDEITISWTLEEGLPNNNCLRCFFLSKDIIKKHADKYLKDFGIIPEFKIGLHYGHVSTGRIGVIKKEIIFTGDVLNTTARIQSICNSYNVDNLISNQLLTRLNLGQEYSSNEIGEIQLRGKDNFIKLFTINPILS